LTWVFSSGTEAGIDPAQKKDWTGTVPPVEEGAMTNDATYELVHSSTPGALSQAVRERINQGWWPMGTPFVHGDRFIQAMVLERPGDNRPRKTSGGG